MATRVRDLSSRCVDWYRTTFGGGVDQRRLTAALLFALAVRAIWCMAMTRTPATFFADNGQYLGMAEGFASGHMPTLGSRHTAFFAPGYSMVLSPLVVVSHSTNGIISVAAMGSALNVILGTSTVLGAAVLARQWFSTRAAVLAAWVLALAPGQIYMTSALLSETLFASLAVWVSVGTTALIRRPRTRWEPLLALGVVIGVAILVRNIGVLLLAGPLLASRPVWSKATLRQVALLVLGSAIVLVPWGVRNGVQVGVWSPMFTGGASSLCLAHSDGATGSPDVDAAGYAFCFEGSPWADPELYERSDAPAATFPERVASVDEAEWFRSTTERALEWIIDNPGRTGQLAVEKVWLTMSSDADALYAAEDFGRFPVASPWRAALNSLATSWLLIVLAAAVVSFVLVGACRRARPLWVLPLAMLLVSLAGIALSRYHHPMMPFLVALASGGVTAPWTAVRSGSYPRPAAFLAAVASGGLAMSVLFNLASQLPGAPCLDFSAPARSLEGIALVPAVGLTMLLSLSGTAGDMAFRITGRGLVLFNVAIVSTAVAWLSRSSVEGCLPAGSSSFVLSLLGLAAWMGALLEAGRCGSLAIRSPWRLHGGLLSALVGMALLCAAGTSLLAVGADVGSLLMADPSQLPRTSFWLQVVGLVLVGVVLVMGIALRVGHGRSASVWKRSRLVAGGAAALGISLLFRRSGSYVSPVGLAELVALLAASWLLFKAVLPDPVRAKRSRGGPQETADRGTPGGPQDRTHR